MKFIFISDIHGCYYTLLRLLKKCPTATHELIFLGDLIDRGPHSRQVIEFAMKNKIRTVLGNHDDMMLGHFGVKGVNYYEPGIWEYNGGTAALNSFPHRYVPQDVLKWVDALPLRIEENTPFGSLLISHTGCGSSVQRMASLWNRSWEFPDDGHFRVFGHTPEGKLPVINEKKRFAMIDTGAAYKSRGLGVLTAFMWPEKTFVQQEYDETAI